METLRFIKCPVCDQSISARSLNERMVGRFQADIRVCNGRKGLPHIAYDGLNISERGLVRQRLLATIQSALDGGIIGAEDLEFLAPHTDVPKAQIPMTFKVAPKYADRKVRVQPTRATRVTPRKEV